MDSEVFTPINCDPSDLQAAEDVLVDVDSVLILGEEEGMLITCLFD